MRRRSARPSARWRPKQAFSKRWRSRGFQRLLSWWRLCSALTLALHHGVRHAAARRAAARGAHSPLRPTAARQEAAARSHLPAGLRLDASATGDTTRRWLRGEDGRVHGAVPGVAAVPPRLRGVPALPGGPAAAAPARAPVRGLRGDQSRAAAILSRGRSC